MTRFALIGILALLTIGQACNEIEDCQLDPYGDYIVVRFSTTNPEIDSIHFTAISLEGLGTLAVDITADPALALPLDANASSARYSFDTDSTSYYFELNYETQASIYELKCEAALRYFNLEMTDHNFDSLVLIADEINLQFIPINVEVVF